MELPLGAGKLSGFLYPFCTVCQAAGVLFLLSLPWSLKWYLIYKNGEAVPRLFWAMWVVLMVSGISAFAILQHAKRVLQGIRNQDPFTVETAKHTEAISRWCLPIAGVYLLGLILLPSALVLLVGIAFLFLWMFIHIIAELFYQAAQYKQENDLTI